ncbi:hypothetical protein TREVI0001_1127 [Treponema vincentii ATCC 35580]|uniref:Uncharacterized protein n=1 Tax=Treponema vincentii ATCC 35580 TaxID=596324 RepID=C8PRW4_9SPIR|nr:hypothetical protein TREVI0001_1127 [Treponema vincentii ATCC 35580]
MIEEKYCESLFQNLKYKSYQDLHILLIVLGLNVSFVCIFLALLE